MRPTEAPRAFVPCRSRRPSRPGPERSPVPRAVDGDGTCPLQTLKREGITLPRGGVRELETWFAEKVATRGELAEFTSEVKAGIEGSAGVPLLLKLFTSFSSAFKANATYKEELRHVIRNTFTQLAEAFNRLIRSAETALAKRSSKSPVRVLFVIDGTDELRSQDRQRLFCPGYRAASGRRYPCHLHGTDRIEIRRCPGRPAG